jgi:hypothetical protein
MNDELSRAAVEVLEILKYVDKEILDKINAVYINELEEIKDLNYVFSIDKSKPIYMQNIMPKTKEILNVLYNYEESN